MTPSAARALAILMLAAGTAQAQPAPRVLQPLTLERAVQDALAQNPSLRAARAGGDAAAAAERAAKALLYPRVTIAESWQRSNQPVFVFSTLLASRRFAEANFAIDRLNQPDAIGSFRGTVGLEQLLFDGGGRRASIDTARVQQQLTDLSTAEAELTLAAAVTDAYGRLLTAQAVRAAAAAALAAGREDLARVTRRRDAGVATEADVLALHVHVADMEQRSIQAEGNGAIIRAQLNQMMGAPVDLEFDAVEPPAGPDAEPAALSVWLAEAAERRPELRRAAAAEQLAEHARHTARAAFMPRLAAQAAVDVNGTRFDDRASSWLVGGELRWSLGLGGGERAQLTAATASASRARAEAAATRTQVEVEVVTALQQARSARARQSVGRAAVAQARESERIIRDRFDAGLAPVNDVLRAAGAVLEADTQRITALVDQVTSTARLNRAVGRLP